MGSQFTSKFSKTFSLDKTVDVDKMSAALKNGVLTVSAPKNLTKLEENIRRIPVLTTATAAVDTPASSNENAKNASTSSDNNDGSEKTEQHKEKEEEEVKSMDAEKGKTSDSSKNGKV